MAGTAGAMHGDWTSALERARAHSPFLARGLERLPDLAAMLEAGEGEAALRSAKGAGEGSADAGLALRREKRALGLVLAIGDLAGAFDLARVMRELSAFADRALHRAIVAAIARRTGEEAAHGFTALALGKHGSGELNYSSDIDPILLYDPQTLPRRSRDEPGEAAQRYAREVVRLLSQQTSEGYVFRVDLRLRPASEVSPLALSFDAATGHYESSALAWERAAFIRARSAAGDIAAGEAFLDAIRSFVWRRSLDFGAIDEVRTLSLRIRAKHSGPLSPAPGYDLKLGRGGIRDIEFAAQTQQLIHGGRDPSLRARDTRTALLSLGQANHLSLTDAMALSASYARLREVEHRLQMVEDRQTHSLPSGYALDGVARLDGMPDGAALVAELRELTERTAGVFDAVLAPDTARTPAPATDERTGMIEARLSEWDGSLKALRSPSARAAFAKLEPDLVRSLAAAPDPRGATIRLERILERVPSALNLFRLLDARPAVLAQLIDALALAPPLADALTDRPQLLDTLLDRSALALPPKTKKIVRAMRRDERGDSYEQRLDRLRIVTAEQRFALGVQLIEGVHDPLAIGRGLARLAEAGVRVALDLAAREFTRTHGTFADGELVVLGLGRLGGGALTHASDLDCVFLFTQGRQDVSDGARPLPRDLYFNRLAQRVVAALSVATARGALYEVDTRLRPQGEQGSLAVSMAGFARYQCDNAWTWEHMALQRGRVVAGSRMAASQVETAIRAALTAPRDPAGVRTDILAMRAEMAAHKPAAGPLDVKLLRGGLVDIEFAVHAVQLREGLVGPPDLGDAIERLSRDGYVPADLGEAHATLTRVLIAVRLLAPALSDASEAGKVALARTLGVAGHDEVLHRIAEARRAVAGAWRIVFEEELAI